MSKAIGVGDAAPDFERPDHIGRPVRLSSLRPRPVVLFFYPKNHTPACTAEACAFRDAYEVFTQAGAEVIGISTGSEASHAGFARRHGLPYRLIADDGSIRRAFGVPRTLGLFPGRVTYVIDGAGIVRHVFNGQLNVGGHIASALDVVRSLASGGTGENRSASAAG